MIPFPKLHIAESVLNRIANTLEERGPLGLGSNPPAPAQEIAPAIAPDPTQLGTELDAAMTQPPQPVAVTPGLESDAAAGAVQESVLGGSPFQGALIAGTQSSY